MSAIINHRQKQQLNCVVVVGGGGGYGDNVLLNDCTPVVAAYCEAVALCSTQ